jgi:ATP-dependent Lon protease
VTPLAATTPTDNAEVEALRRAVMQQFDQYVKLNKKIPPEILTSIASIDEPAAWPTPSPRTCRSSWTSRSCWTWRRQGAAGDLFEQLEREVDILRSTSASVAASSARWRRASASTT